MSIFSGLRQYASKWSVSGMRNFTDEERAEVTSAEVVSSQYGNSVCFHMKGGYQTFIPLANDSTLTVGENVDLEKAKVLTLSKPGELDITRVSI